MSEKRVSGATSESVISFYVYITVDITLLLNFLGSNPAIAESCDYFNASCDHHLDYCILTCYGPTLPFLLLARFDKDNDNLSLFRILRAMMYSVRPLLSYSCQLYRHLLCHRIVVRMHVA